MKCLDNAKFTYGIVRTRNDFLKLSKLTTKTNFKIFLGDIKNQNFIERILNFSKKNNRIINGLINNAGERQRIDFLMIKKKELTHIFENNFFSHFILTQKLIKTFLSKKKNSFSIVNIGSIVGVNGFNQLSGYASTKQALEGFTKVLQLNLRIKILDQT